MEKYKECEDCVYGVDEVFKKSDCDKCEAGSNYLSFQTFNEDMDFWCEDYPAEDIIPEETKSKYILISWLIRAILKHNENDCAINFVGISHKPFGRKRPEDMPHIFGLLFPFVYVNEKEYGGYSGDCFSGSLYYRLLPFIWLEFHYSC